MISFLDMLFKFHRKFCCTQSAYFYFTQPAHRTENASHMNC